MAALFHAKHKRGVTEYISCRSGIDYSIIPDEGGFTVKSDRARLTFWTTERREALRLVETMDLASLANKGAANDA